MIKRMVILALCLIIISSCHFRPQVVPYTVYLPVVASIKSFPMWGIGSTYGNCLAISRLEAQWYYDWTIDPEYCPFAERVAMIWDENTLGQIPVDVDTVLWFNEPDQEAQADMTPQEAATLWNQYRPLYSDFRNGSPAISDPDWLDAWLKLIEIKPDFLCVHIYESKCDLAEAKRRFLIHLDGFLALANEWNIPLWITEFAWVSDSEDVPAFIRWAKAEIASRPEIERAAWFEDWYRGDEWWAPPVNTSLTNQAGELNALGRAYRD